MRRFYFLSFVIILSLVTQIFPGAIYFVGVKPATAYAEGEPEYEWELIETEIIPDTLPLQATFDTDMAVKGDITQNSATVTYRV